MNEQNAVPCKCGIPEAEWRSLDESDAMSVYSCNQCFNIIASGDRMTKDEALQAIRARIEGVWDDPALQKLGPLHPHQDRDILRIMDMVTVPPRL